ncbi:MAG: HAMP domain-containing histidine kinase [Clostridia bacterium]|nr:HAMP domain-containing histidine kinase [Clostridia bacterium]
MKKTETAQIGTQVENIFKNSLDYKEEIDKTAYRNSASIYILSLDGELFYTNTTSTGTNFYNQNGYIAQMPGRNVSIDISDIAKDIMESSSKKVTYTLDIDRLKTQIYVYAKQISDTNYCYVIIMPIDPIDATSTVITSQLIYITVISLIISTIISLFMSRRISRPIMEMNESAKKLGKGDYNVIFEKCGYDELDELADTLNSATTSLERTDEIRRELLANVSHDLKTPLTMIKAYSEMIRDLSGDNKQKREAHLKVIIDETDRLTRLVNDMMDLSKIESGIITLNKEKFNFSQVATSLIDTIKMSNMDTPHEIKYTIPNDLYVYADRTKIEQVLYNLVINAIKHSGEGNRKIDVKVTATQKRVKVEVKDDGVGISKEDLKHIWDRYYKASESFTRNVQGSGLGLSIVKNILLKHSSDFGVDSEVGKGTTFWFDLERITKKEATIDKINKKD